MRRIVAILGGGWADASVHHLEIPYGMELEGMKGKYKDWYNKMYIPELQAKEKCRFISFPEFLVDQGATEADVEEFWE